MSADIKPLTLSDSVELRPIVPADYFSERVFPVSRLLYMPLPAPVGLGLERYVIPYRLRKPDQLLIRQGRYPVLIIVHRLCTDRIITGWPDFRTACTGRFITVNPIQGAQDILTETVMPVNSIIGIIDLDHISLCRPEHLLPLWKGDVIPVLWSALPLLGILGYGLFAAFLLGDMEPAPQGRRDWVLWGGGGCLLLGLEQAVVIGNLGPELAGRLTSPFFALAKSVGVDGAFQRVESMIAALWTFADLVLLGVLAFGVWKAAEALLPRVRQKAAVTGALLPGMILGIAAFPEGVMAESFGRGGALLGNLLLGTILPPVVFLACWGRGIFRRDPYLVYKTRKRAKDIVAEENMEEKGEKSD